MRKRTLGSCNPTIWTIVSCALLLVVLTTPATAQKFYPDDPLEKEPAPVATYDPGFRDLSEIMEFVNNIFGNPGERHPEVGVIPAGGVNTLGEVPDSPWYVNRHADTLDERKTTSWSGRQRPSF